MKDNYQFIKAQKQKINDARNNEYYIKAAIEWANVDMPGGDCYEHQYKTNGDR